ncbi:MAG: 2-oxoacid:acceptor oxidoreductase family protein, partial [Kiritimatiellae bacterium]|nr:2-oxoacid:acceptor oxidoreductase family protein [Kiritimatiellia bacterium]
VYDHLDGKCSHGFTVGINDDVTNTSIAINTEINTADADTTCCMFWGLGSDGTVGANKNSIKIIGDNTDMFAQGYFVYDSKKSYGITISHLRFGTKEIKSTYLINSSDFVACHNPAYIGRYDMLKGLKAGGTFLLNSEETAADVFETLTEDMQRYIIDNKIKFYTIDALKIAESVGLGNRINTVMQVAFFKLANIIDPDEAIDYIKKAIEKTFKVKGDDIVKMNWAAVDGALDVLAEVQVPAEITKSFVPVQLIKDDAIPFAKDVIEKVMHLKGDDIPVSKMSIDGAVPSGTTALEKRGIAPRIPEWLADKCIQCNQCVMSCPHAVVRAKQIAPADLADKPEGFETVLSKTKNESNLEYKLQIYCEDCTGCGVCVDVCPAKEKALGWTTLEEYRAKNEPAKVAYFDALPDNVTEGVSETSVKGVQFIKPLFEFSGACAGCGETPYVKLVTQIAGERMIVANATGCSSIYGGTFPTIPYCKSKEGRGPTWANSLFEDNAEYGFGMRLAVDKNRELLKHNVDKLLEGGKGASDELKSALQASLELWD